jgi:hypothetical protein
MAESFELAITSNCPPVDANPPSDNLYVFVKNNPPTSNDFLTAHEKGIHLDADPCLRRALSCGVSVNYLDSILNLFPIKRGWKKAIGQALSDDGKIKQTGANSFHHSLWLEEESKKNFHTRFKVI